MHGNDQHLDELTKAKLLGLQLQAEEAKVKSKANSTNPKDLIGSTKVSLTKVPAVALLHCAHAMMDGARKYDAYNWRAKDVVADIYVDAAIRHLLSWFEGEEVASDSKCHHLGHAMACCAILLDAQENGNLIDNRPVTDQSRGVATRVLERLSGAIKAKIAELKAEETVNAPQSINNLPADVRAGMAVDRE